MRRGTLETIMSEAVQTYEAPKPQAALPHLSVAILGAGKMGGILLQAFLKNNLVNAESIFATVQHAPRAVALSAQFGVQVTTDNLGGGEGRGRRDTGREAVAGDGAADGGAVRADAEEAGALDRGGREARGDGRGRGQAHPGDPRDAQHAGDADGGHDGVLPRHACDRRADADRQPHLPDGGAGRWSSKKSIWMR